MKKDIHPKYNTIKVTCSCGNTFQVGSTLDSEEINVELCSKCHPFYTGEQKIVDADNLVQKYEEKMKKAKTMSFRSKKAKMEARKSKKEGITQPSSTLTLKDMLANADISK
ncbi:50S ribosomal protein L31 [bacterium]|nr:50S ribosomal protein L31 [bacterium]